jgi:hypothetical protein
MDIAKDTGTPVTDEHEIRRVTLWAISLGCGSILARTRLGTLLAWIKLSLADRKRWRKWRAFSG